MATKPIKIPTYPTIKQVLDMNKGNTIRQSTDAENSLASYRDRYQKNGKTTLSGAAKILGDTVLTSGKRIIGIDGYKKGGKVDKTKVAKVHKGEVVLPKKIVKNKTFSQVKNSVLKTMGKK